MKKRLLLVGLVVLSLALLAGCKPSEENLGLVTVSLNGDPDSGYAWSYEIMEPVIFKEESNGYEERAAQSDATVEGGTYSWTFLPEKYGRTDIVFTYAKADAAAEEEALYTVSYTLSSDKTGQLKFEGSSGNYPDSAVPLIVNKPAK